MKLAILDDYQRVALRCADYVTGETYVAFYTDTLESIEAWLDGKPVRVTNPEALA